MAKSAYKYYVPKKLGLRSKWLQVSCANKVKFCTDTHFINHHGWPVRNVCFACGLWQYLLSRDLYLKVWMYGGAVQSHDAGFQHAPQSAKWEQRRKTRGKVCKCWSFRSAISMGSLVCHWDYSSLKSLPFLNCPSSNDALQVQSNGSKCNKIPAPQ